MGELVDTELLADSVDLNRKAAKENARTSYVVLSKEGRTGHWIELETVTATTSAAAIRQVVEFSGSTYVAVPARSWRPVVMKQETKTVTRLEPA